MDVFFKGVRTVRISPEFLDQPVFPKGSHDLFLANAYYTPTFHGVFSPVGHVKNCADGSYDFIPSTNRIGLNPVLKDPAWGADVPAIQDLRIHLASLGPDVRRQRFPYPDELSGNDRLLREEVLPFVARRDGKGHSLILFEDENGNMTAFGRMGVHQDILTLPDLVVIPDVLENPNNWHISFLHNISVSADQACKLLEKYAADMHVRLKDVLSHDRPTPYGFGRRFHELSPQALDLPATALRVVHDGSTLARFHGYVAPGQDKGAFCFHRIIDINRDGDFGLHAYDANHIHLGGIFFVPAGDADFTKMSAPLATFMTALKENNMWLGHANQGLWGALRRGANWLKRRFLPNRDL